MLKMQNEAKKMQKKLKEQKIVGESKDGLLKIYMNAAQEFENIEIDPEILDPEQMDRFKNRMKEAFKDYQKKLQKQMVQSMDIDSLKNMFS
ncbi:YbaB/EbfC family nucleoid-associated protein [Candidatus Dojkabacteria bacterium]|nr:YbaB/EbfC family nucleoid-associated protein [Candidatus Dojkabacteria bacterium]